MVPYRLVSGVDQLVVCRLAEGQARVLMSARHPTSEDTIRIQEDGPRRMVKDKLLFCMNECYFCVWVCTVDSLFYE